MSSVRSWLSRAGEVFLRSRRERRLQEEIEVHLDMYVQQGQVETTRAAALVGVLARNAGMYGISTVYLRAKNLVPPASEGVSSFGASLRRKPHLTR